MKSENKMTFKICTKCGKNKSTSEFYKDKKGANGCCAICKECAKEKSILWYYANPIKAVKSRKKWREENFEKNKEYKRKYYLANKERIDKENKAWRSAHPERVKELSKKWAMENPERDKELHLRWRRENPERDRHHKKKWERENIKKSREGSKRWAAANKEKMSKWIKENPESVRIIKNRYSKKCQNTLKGRLNNIIRNGILHSLKRGSKAGRHWENIVDFNIEELRVHLEKQFTEEMNWGNQGSYWHIDHNIPISVFNFNTPDDMDFKLCWALKNLRPLEAIENISKGARIDKPFQPSLLLAV